MAMAELNQLPRAPPPSPEAQQRAIGTMFDFPPSALDLTRQEFAVALDFVLTQASNSSLTNSSSSPLSTVPEKGSPCDSFLNEDDEDDLGFPGSPKKRVCNSPCSFPEGYYSQLTSSTSSKFSNSSTSHSKTSRHRRSPAHSHSPPTTRNSPSPPFIRPPSFQQTRPHTIPQRIDNGFGSESFSHNNHTPIPSCNSTLPPPSHLGMLSKSFDLHNVHPFSTDMDPILPEMRTRRAYTLGATEDDNSQRKRKVSLKRTKEERDSDLQFSFEYSLTSSSSNEASDWLVVSPDTTTTQPVGKKACQQHIPPSTAQISPLPLIFAQSNTSYNISSVHRPLNLPPAANGPPLFISEHSSTSIVNPLEAVLADQPTSLASIESVQMMDTGDTSLRLDSFDSMECGQYEQPVSLVDMDTQQVQSPLSHMQLPHQQGPLRTHSSSYRHSFVNNEVPPVTNYVGNEGTSVNFSKSL